MITIKTSGVKKAMNNITKRIENASGNSVYESARDGAEVASISAPKGTGKLRGHIRSEKTGKNSARIISRNPSAYNHDGFSLPLWLHANSNNIEVPYAGKRAGYLGPVNSPQDHINSGRARYMDIAYRHVLTQTDGNFNKNF